MSLWGLFLEGLLSFLSPCVLPMVPLYMSYLATNKNNKKIVVFLNSLFFVLGLSVIFLILALAIDTIKPLIDEYSTIITLISGIIIIIFGLHETGLITIQVNIRQKDISMDTSNMNFIKAFLLGFLFSLVISPCIGPMLSSAILLAASSKVGGLYILIYALGLLIPFFITGLFTTSVVSFLKNKKNILKYVGIIAGIILVIYGGYMTINSSKDIIDLKNSNSTTASQENASEGTSNYLPGNDFYDQNGNIIHLSDYKGQYVMMNFIATWCTYCVNEIPEYLEFAKAHDDIKCFYVMSPNSSGVSKEEIITFIEEKGIDIEVIIDEDNVLYSLCNPSAFPTMFVADKENKILGYVSGAYDLEGFNSILESIKEQYG